MINEERVAAAMQKEATESPTKLWWLLIFLLSCGVVVSRRPDAILHAQFYIEDGVIWFAQAYNWGWCRVLFWPYNGYIQVLPRLAAALALLVPFRFAPLVESLIAIALQALPASLLLSPRSRAWGSTRFRAALAILYLALPNTQEITGTVSLSQFILALCAFLLLVALPPRSMSAWIFDGSILLLCGLTGPFCLFLLPIALYLLCRRSKDVWTKFATAILFLTSLIQGAVILALSSEHRHPPLAASIDLSLRILGGQVYLGTLLGGNTLSARLSLVILFGIAIAGSLIIVLGIWTSCIEMRLFLLLASLVFGASLADPGVFRWPHRTAWEVLSMAPGTHYWFFPSLAFAWSLAWCLRSGRQVLQVAAGALFLLMTVGFIRDYRYPALSDLNFPIYARRLDAAPRGSVIVIPENPSYGTWQARLIKH